MGVLWKVLWKKVNNYKKLSAAPLSALRADKQSLTASHLCPAVTDGKCFLKWRTWTQGKPSKLVPSRKWLSVCLCHLKFPNHATFLSVLSVNERALFKSAAMIMDLPTPFSSVSFCYVYFEARLLNCTNSELLYLPHKHFIISKWFALSLVIFFTGSLFAVNLALSTFSNLHIVHVSSILLLLNFSTFLRLMVRCAYIWFLNRGWQVFIFNLFIWYNY